MNEPIEPLQTEAYTTLPSDTRESVARQFGITPDELEQFNPGVAGQIPYKSGTYPSGTKLLIEKKPRIQEEPVKKPQAAAQDQQWERPIDFDLVRQSDWWNKEATSEQRVNALADFTEHGFQYAIQNGVPKEEAEAWRKDYFAANRWNALDNKVPAWQHVPASMLAVITDDIGHSVAGLGRMLAPQMAAYEADLEREVPPETQSEIMAKLSESTSPELREGYIKELGYKHGIEVVTVPGEEGQPERFHIGYKAPIDPRLGGNPEDPDQVPESSNLDWIGPMLSEMGKAFGIGSRRGINKVLKENPALAETWLYGKIPSGTAGMAGMFGKLWLGGPSLVIATAATAKAEEDFLNAKAQNATGEQAAQAAQVGAAIGGASVALGIKGSEWIMKTPLGQSVSSGALGYFFTGTWWGGIGTGEKIATNIAEKYSGIDPERKVAEWGDFRDTFLPNFVGAVAMHGTAEWARAVKTQIIVNKVSSVRAQAVLDGTDPMMTALKKQVTEHEDPRARKIAQGIMDKATARAQNLLENVKSSEMDIAGAQQPAQATVKPGEPAKPQEKQEKRHPWVQATEEEIPGRVTAEKRNPEAGKGNAPRMGDLTQATAERSYRLQLGFQESREADLEIRRAVPDEGRRGALAIWLEAAGDETLLQSWAAQAKGDEFRNAAEMAQTLTPEEQAIGRKMRGAWDILLERGQNYGVLNEGRDNYVPHIYKAVPTRKLQSFLERSTPRHFLNLFEADQAGFIPKTMDVAKLFPGYTAEMTRVIADRLFVRNVSEGVAEDTRPLVSPRGTVKTVDKARYYIKGPDGAREGEVFDTMAEAIGQLRKRPNSERAGRKIVADPTGSKIKLINPGGVKIEKGEAAAEFEQADYKIIDQPAFKSWKWAHTDAEGNQVFFKGEAALHPDLARRVEAMLGRSKIRQWYEDKGDWGLTRGVKEVAGFIDRAQGTMKREMFSMLQSFHMVQEGTHAIGHMVLPAGNKPVDMRSPEVADSVRHGLTLFPDRVNANQVYAEGVGGEKGWVAQFAEKFGKEPGKKLSKIITGYQDWLFHEYIPSLKQATYERLLEGNRKTFAKDIESGKVTEGDVKLLSAREANEAYGHLNYAELDRDPTIQHMLQLATLAPDFAEARLRFSWSAAKGAVGVKAGREQTKAMMRLAVAQVTGSVVLAQVLKASGLNASWDPKRPFELTVENRRYFLRSVPEDLWRWLGSGIAEQVTSDDWSPSHVVNTVLGPEHKQFMTARTNPLLAGVMSIYQQRNWRGEKVSTLEATTDMLANFLPISARALPGLNQLSASTRNSPVTPLEQFAGSMGLKISRYSPISKVHQFAGIWMDEQDIPRQDVAYPVSKYQRLRYALEDGDLGLARKEYQKLLKMQPDMDAEKLAKGFEQSVNNPFTNSQANDEKFAASLEGEELAIYEHAIAVKDGLINKFDAIADRPVRTSEERAAMDSEARWKQIEQDAGIIYEKDVPVRVEVGAIEKITRMMDAGTVTGPEAGGLFKKVQEINKDAFKQLTDEERKIKAKGVDSGARAAFMKERLRKMPDDAAREAQILRWNQAGLFTPKVRAQMAE